MSGVNSACRRSHDGSDRDAPPITDRFALSIRQPWATLVVFGIKTIEIRKWSTRRTGQIYIHAGQQADRRDQGWRFVPPELREYCALRGGLVGRAVLEGCRKYLSRNHFAREAKLHRNLPEWFEEPAMHGFVLRDAEAIPFERFKGGLYFFKVPASEVALDD